MRENRSPMSRHIVADVSTHHTVELRGIEPPQPKAADLQIDARVSDFAAENSRNSEQTRIALLEKVRGVIYEGRADVKSSASLRRRPVPRHQVAVRASHLFERVSWWTCGQQAAQSDSDRPSREVMTLGERAWTDLP